MASPLPIFLILSSLSTLSAAYTWNFVSPPKQCSNLTISLVGSGVPPYSLLVLPSGPTPLSSGIEVRRILNVPFSGNSVSFMFNYPAYSGFVAVVSITPYFLFFFFLLIFLFLSFSLLFSMLSSLSMSHLSMLYAWILRGGSLNALESFTFGPHILLTPSFALRWRIYVSFRSMLHAPLKLSPVRLPPNPLQSHNIFIIRFVTFAYFLPLAGDYPNVTRSSKMEGPQLLPDFNVEVLELLSQRTRLSIFDYEAFSMTIGGDAE